MSDRVLHDQTSGDSFDPTAASSSRRAVADSWLSLFNRAVSTPSVNTFTYIIRDADVNIRRALAWLFYSVFASTLVFLILFPSIFVWRGVTSAAYAGSAVTAGILLGVLAAPLAGIVTVLFVGLMAFVIHRLCMDAGSREGTREEMLFALASFITPLSVLNIFINLILYLLLPYPVPAVEVITVTVLIYQFFLTIAAVQPVYQIKPARALVASLFAIIPWAVVWMLTVNGMAVGQTGMSLAHQTYESDLVSFTYPGYWKQVSVAEINDPDCAIPEWNCMITLRHGLGEVAVLQVVNMPIIDTMTLDQMSASLLDKLEADHPRAAWTLWETTTIDGYAAIHGAFTSQQRQYEVVYVMVNRQIIRFTFVAKVGEGYDSYQNDVDQIITSIIITNDSA